MSFGRPWGLFWHPFEASVVSVGLLVSSFWLRLARPGCQWGLSARFLWCLWPVWAVCKLSLLLLNQFRGSFSCSFCVFYIACRVSVVQGLWFESSRATFFLLEILNALPVPVLRQVSVFGCLDLQNSAPMQVKFIFSRQYRLVGCHD